MTGKINKELEFSEKYSEEHALNYYKKHNATFGRRMSNWRELKMAKTALKIAGSPKTVMDIPCGAGRFWETLSSSGVEKIIACDYNETMIDVASKHCKEELLNKVTFQQASAFEIPFAENSVDSVFSMRLLHHIGKSEDRKKMLKEFARVSSGTVIFSLWVDGNYKAMRRKKLEIKKHGNGKGDYQNRFLIPQKTIESEISELGLKIIDKVNFLKFYSMWKIYILKADE